MNKKIILTICLAVFLNVVEKDVRMTFSNESVKRLVLGQIGTSVSSDNLLKNAETVKSLHEKGTISVLNWARNF